jgi:DNA primase
MQRKSMFGSQGDQPDDRDEHTDHLADGNMPSEELAPGPSPGIRQARDESGDSGARPGPSMAHANVRSSAPTPGPTLLQRIKDAKPLLAYARTLTELKKAPGNADEHYGKCPDPAHDDKGPSFHVNEAKNLFHCKGCGITGNVVQLYALMNGMDPEDAKFELGKQLGVFNERRLDTGESMVANAARRFADQLKKKDDALAYLVEERKISQKSIERFGIGYCWGREFQDIQEVERQRLAIDYGLAREETGRAHMAGRIVFPVRDRGGMVLGFGGRLVPNGFQSNGPKYINSPETAIFKKSELLYGAYEAAAGIHKAGYASIVEGYIDVVMLHQHDVTNAVAVMGAGANETTFATLWQMTKRAVFCLDGDAAGAKGGLRSVYAAAPTMEDGCEIAITTLPDGMDPDEYVLQFGAEAWRQMCDQAVPLSRFLMNERSAKFDLSYAEGRASFLTEAREIAELFVNAPTVRQQIVGEARALNAAALVHQALTVTGLAETMSVQELDDAIALLQRRKTDNMATARSAPAPTEGATRLPRPR